MKYAEPNNSLMKSIVVRILAGLVTFFIGWSCANVRFILFPRVSALPECKAEEIDHGSNVESSEAGSMRDSEAFKPLVSWDGSVRRGKIDVRAGGSAWSFNGVTVSHTQEIYGSSEAARYVLSQLRGEWRSKSEVAPRAVSCEFKVRQRKKDARIAWVSGSDLHYVEASSYSVAIALLDSWGDFDCR
jgi:hypothetical protein